MQAPMKSKIRKFIENPINAQKLTELTIQNSKENTEFEIDLGNGEKIKLKQI